MSPELADLHQRKKVLMVIGTGGVGKTTSAIAIALAAARKGKRVALLSIDPARRLAAAIGLKLDANLHEVKAYPEVGGRLDAMMLDPKVVFDRMVKEFSKSEDRYLKIMENPLYQAASTKLAGTTEFMALAKISEIHHSGQYDFMVVDTPPDTHSIHFLYKPHILSAFQDNKVTQWFIKPLAIASRFGLGSILNLGEKVMSGLFQITGLQALHVLTDFLLLIKDVIQGLHQSGLQIRKILKSEDSGFLMVGVPSQASLQGMINLANELAIRSLRLDGILLNKCLPEEISREILRRSEHSFFHTNNELASFYARAISEEEIKLSLHEKFSDSKKDEFLIFNVAEKDDPLLSLEAMEAF